MCSSTRACTRGIELGQRVVQQQHRRAADRPLHRPRLGQAQGERHQPLLAPRAEEPQVPAVAARPARSSRCGPTSVCPRRALPRETAPRGRARKPVRRRLRPELPPIPELDLARARQRPDRAARASRSSASTAGRRRRAARGRRARAARSTARGPRAARPGDRRSGGDGCGAPPPAGTGRAPRVCRIELAGEAVEEVAARLRPPVDDGQVLPAERDHARPGTPFAAHSPGPSSRGARSRGESARGVSPRRISPPTNGAGGAPARAFGRLGSAERAADAGGRRGPSRRFVLPWALGPVRMFRSGAGVSERRSIVAKIGQLYPVNIHPIRSLP